MDLPSDSDHWIVGSLVDKWVSFEEALVEIRKVFSRNELMISGTEKQLQNPDTEYHKMGESTEGNVRMQKETTNTINSTGLKYDIRQGHSLLKMSSKRFLVVMFVRKVPTRVSTYLKKGNETRFNRKAFLVVSLFLLPLTVKTAFKKVEEMKNRGMFVLLEIKFSQMSAPFISNVSFLLG